MPARKKFLKKEVTEANAINFIVGKVALSPPDISFKLKDENYKELVEKAKQAGVKVLYANAGNICLNNNKLNISCLSPEMNETYSDINSSSAVYMVEDDGHRIILTGDMTKETEKKIMKTGIGVMRGILINNGKNILAMVIKRRIKYIFHY